MMCVCVCKCELSVTTTAHVHSTVGAIFILFIIRVEIFSAIVCICCSVWLHLISILRLIIRLIWIIYAILIGNYESAKCIDCITI